MDDRNTEGIHLDEGAGGDHPQSAKDPEKLFCFELGGHFLGRASIGISRYADRTEATYRMIAFAKALEEEKRVFGIPGQLMRELNELLARIGAAKWGCYHAPVLDGVQWSLSFSDDGGLHESSGSNAFPDGFDELARFLIERFGCKAFATALNR